MESLHAHWKQEVTTVKPVNPFLDFSFPACPDFFIKIAFSVLIKQVFKVTEILKINCEIRAFCLFFA